MGIYIPKKQLLSLGIIILILAAIPLTILLVREQQDVRKRAQESAQTRIEFVDVSGTQITSTTSQNVRLKLTYVLPSPSPNPSPSSTSSPSPSPPPVGFANRVTASSVVGTTSTITAHWENVDNGIAVLCVLPPGGGESAMGSWGSPSGNESIQAPWINQGSYTFKLYGNSSVACGGTLLASTSITGSGSGSDPSPSPNSIPPGSSCANLSVCGTGLNCVSSQCGATCGSNQTQCLEGSGQPVCCTIPQSTPSNPGGGNCRSFDGNLPGCNAAGGCAYYSCSESCWTYGTDIQTACPGYVQGAAVAYPTSFRIANSQAELESAAEQSFSPPTQTVSWTLPLGNGQKTVFAQFKLNDVWEKPLADTITLLLSSATPTPALPQQQGWHYGQTNVLFEWQYHWVRSSNGYWTIFSVGQAGPGTALLMITGTPTGQKTVHVYPGVLTASSQGFDITFQGDGVSYRGTQDKSGDHIVLSAPDFSFAGTFSESIGTLNHGTVQVAQGISSPDYYSRPLLANGTMTIAGEQIPLQNALAENDHQYGVGEVGIANSSKLSPLTGQSLTIAHDWIFATLGDLAIAGTRIKDKSSNAILANYIVVQKQGKAQERANDVVFTPVEFYANNFSKKIHVSSTQLQLDMDIEIPDQNSLILGNVLQEDGNANVKATYRGQSYSGFGIKESTDQTAQLLGSPTLQTQEVKGDINKDGKVDGSDINILVQHFGQTGNNIQGDVNGDGKVDIYDYNIVVENFGKR